MRQIKSTSIIRYFYIRYSKHCSTIKDAPNPILRPRRPLPLSTLPEKSLPCIQGRSLLSSKKREFQITKFKFSSPTKAHHRFDTNEELSIEGKPLKPTQ